MSFNVKTISAFEKHAKPLLKKYPSLHSELATLISSLKQNPTQGTAIGEDCYKIRLAIASKNKGKSGGARIITYVAIVEESVYLLTIYDKSEEASISDKELRKLLEDI